MYVWSNVCVVQCTCMYGPMYVWSNVCVVQCMYGPMYVWSNVCTYILSNTLFIDRRCTVLSSTWIQHNNHCGDSDWLEAQFSVSIIMAIARRGEEVPVSLQQGGGRRCQYPYSKEGGGGASIPLTGSALKIHCITIAAQGCYCTNLIPYNYATLNTKSKKGFLWT